MFVRRVRGADLDRETERIVLLAGLRALDDRDIGVLDELRMAGIDEDFSGEESLDVPTDGAAT